MTERYKASPALEGFILDRAPRHHASPDAPNDFEALVAWFYASKVGDSMPVHDGANDKTIYSHQRYNLAMRAWHDRVHIDENLGFSKLDELKVCSEQIRIAMQHKVMYRLTEEDFSAIRCDIAGQVLYYYKHKEYVNDQALFVGACMERGIFETLRKGGKF